MFKGHRMPITCMATDPKGLILYTGGQDKMIIAWDANRGTIMKVGTWSRLDVSGEFYNKLGHVYCTHISNFIMIIDVIIPPNVY